MADTVLPVYMVAGFLEAGKTTFIKGLLSNEDITQGHRNLLLACGEGEEEYEDEFLTANNIDLRVIEDSGELTRESMRSLTEEAQPAAVFVEWNGTWDLRDTVLQFPSSWRRVMVITIVDGSTYELYSQNMGNWMYRHISAADAVTINRCTPEIREMLFRRNIIAMNPKAQIELENTDGTTEDYVMNLPSPFDLDAEVVEIPLNDFGLWYIDAVRRPKKYEGHVIRFIGEVKEMKRDRTAVIGRLAMVCCAEDMTFYGISCEDVPEGTREGDWMRVTGKVSVQDLPMYKGEGPVVRVLETEPYKAPEDKVLNLV